MIRVSLLESALFEALTAHFTNADIVFSSIFRKTKNEIAQGNTVITISSISDSIEGSIISREIIHPLISFVIFNQDFAKSRQIQESLIQFLNSLNPFDLQMGDSQQANHSFLVRRLPPTFDTKLEIFISGVDYRFHIRNFPET